ncbi:MAG TPA: hypothetical protein PLD63_14265, partial [Ignavibacteria bacterium]|nr:hypothetical protein [Ignavibacteria bacterium]
MADKVSKIDKNGVVTFYSTYNAARTASGNNPGDHDLIQILADLTEQIILKDKVDIWIMPGVVIDQDPSNPGETITDDNETVECTIYGYGVIKNTGSSSCIRVENPGSKLSVECDYIQNVNGVAVNISPSLKFHLKCNYVYSQNLQAIRIGKFAEPGMVEEVRLDVTKVETGDVNNSSTGTTALSTRGNGFVRIDEIICNNLGHCLSHQEGTITARIKKMTSIMNRSGGNVSTVHLAANQGSAGQKLILYFDEINCFNGATNNALCGIECTIGTGIFIGRRVYSEIISSLDGAAIQIGGANTKGYLKCDNVTSLNHVALVLNDTNEQITIDVNSIEFGGAAGIFSNGSVSNRGNFFIRNAKIKSMSQSTSAKGIFINNIYPIFTLNNLKIISGSDVNSNIFIGNNTIDVFNLGWFGNSGIDQTK